MRIDPNIYRLIFFKINLGKRGIQENSRRPSRIDKDKKMDFVKTKLVDIPIFSWTQDRYITIHLPIQPNVNPPAPKNNF